MSECFENFIALSDSYKYSHYKQYPKNTSRVYSYFESRGGRFDHTIMFGLQYILRRYFVNEVFNLEDIDYMSEICANHFGSNELFNEEGWRALYAKHQGRLPLSIKAVPEGTSVPVGNVLMTVENTDPEFYWLTNFAETILVQSWYPITVATLSYECKKLISRYLEISGSPDQIGFKLHDFGFRGSTSVESAALGGAGHLVNFLGTDTMIANVLLREYYNSQIAGFSIPASEHSTITSWGKDHEVDAMRNMLEQYPSGLVACVSDSYDIYRACEKYWGEDLKDLILKRDGCLVVRPDSGHPPKIVCDVLNILSSRIGCYTNEKGFKVLDDHIRIIQGDGCNYEMIDEILNEMMKEKWSADNIAFGMGGGLLQKVDRDTQMFAFKCSAINVDGEWRDVYKDPVTMSSKKSKRGQLKLLKTNEGYTTAIKQEDTELEDQLVEVFRDGHLLVNYDLDSIRKRASL